MSSSPSPIKIVRIRKIFMLMLISKLYKISRCLQGDRGNCIARNSFILHVKNLRRIESQCYKL